MLELGIASLAEAEARGLTAEEIEEWHAFWLVEPFGCTKQDQRFGKLMALFLQMKGQKDITWDDFYPGFDGENRPPDIDLSPEQFMALFEAGMEKGESQKARNVDTSESTDKLQS